MSHEGWFLPIMSQIANLHPLDFLNALTTIHPWWHTRGSRFIGFLTFHKEVILAFQSSLATVSADAFYPPPLANPSPPYNPALDTINDLNQFSAQIEGWHNMVHMSPQFPPIFMDPARNIYLYQFWQFHHLIDQKFDQALMRAGYSDFDAFRLTGGDLHRTV